MLVAGLIALSLMITLIVVGVSNDSLTVTCLGYVGAVLVVIFTWSYFDSHSSYTYCPVCHAQYTLEYKYCPVDGTELTVATPYCHDQKTV